MAASGQAGRRVTEGAIRLTGGEWSGARLFSPAGRVARPALAKVRGAIFNVLSGMDGTRVLDLYAGTGALGFEALSRGAAFVTFFERDPDCLEAIRANAAKLRCEAKVRILDGEVASQLAKIEGEGADLAFADPPYADVDVPVEREKFRGVLARLAAEGGLRKGGWLLVEHRARVELPVPEGFVDDERREYGQTGIAIFRAKD
ncbi:MAG: RsmD family RNA methyltransferase [Planctomycetes bacterium]|nr:RsmD family RNA methyltransferase [Planctomycetota bacterium]